MKLISLFFLILLLNNCGQKATVESQPTKVLTKELSEIPTFPSCETSKNAIDKEFCLTNSIQELIASEVKTNNLILTSDTLRVGIRVEVNGSCTIIENKSSNKELEKLSKNVLENLPNIIPAHSKTLDRKVTSAYFFDVIFLNNALTSKWEK